MQVKQQKVARFLYVEVHHNPNLSTREIIRPFLERGEFIEEKSLLETLMMSDEMAVMKGYEHLINDMRHTVKLSNESGVEMKVIRLKEMTLILSKSAKPELLK